MRTPPWRSLSLLCVFLLLQACGGSGSSPAPFGPELVEGPYRLLLMENTANGDARVITSIWTPTGGQFVPSDTWFASQGSSGMPDPNAPAFPIPFNVLPDRTFTIIDDQYRGRITPDGMLATAVSTTGDTDSALAVLVRQQQTPLLSGLAGTWKALGFGRSTDNPYTSVATVGDVTIDVNGVLNFTALTSNFDGQIDPLPQVFNPAQFAVLAGGTLALSQAGQLIRRGGISQDGNVILLAGNFITGIPSVLVLVRKSTAGPSDFSGNYAYTGLEFILTSPQAQWGPLDRAAPGNASAQLSFLSQGVPFGPFATSFGVGLLADGELTMVLQGPQPQPIFRGMVASGGAYAFYGGGISPLSARQFAVLVR